MLVFRNLSKSFKKQIVLNQLNFDIASGERVVLTGQNGSGKTTLIRCLLGLYHYEGEVSFFGKNIHTSRQDALFHMAFVPQAAPLFKNTVQEMIQYAHFFCQCSPEKISQICESLSQPLELILNKSFVSLSGGMKQKLLIAIALARPVKVLILDEPTANLDPQARVKFYEHLQKIDPQTTVILTSHRIDELVGVVSRVIELDAGRIVIDKNVSQKGIKP